MEKIKISRNSLPIQKCLFGEPVQNLSDNELLAIIIGTGMKSSGVLEISSSLLSKSGGLRGILHSGIREITKQKGIGPVKAVKIHAALELGRRALRSNGKSYMIDTPLKVWELLHPEMAGANREEFRVLLLNNKNILLKNSIVSIGTVSEAIVHPREVFTGAIKEGASSIIMAHNHPSGIVSPSKEDICTTERIATAGQLIGIPLLDHIIITDSGYLSLKEEGYIHH